MKKTLHFLIIASLFTTAINAQTKTWNFGNDTATWPLNSVGNGTGAASPFTDSKITDNLGLYACAPTGSIINFAIVEASAVSAGNFADSFTAVNRFKLNGAGYPTGPFLPMPTQRYLYADVSGACTVKVWFKTGSGGTARTVYVTDGTTIIGQAATTTAGGVADYAIVNANYTGAAHRLYVYCDLAVNLYKMEITGATVNTTLANENFSGISPVNIFSNGKQINVSNIVSSTKIELYDIKGALVKSVTTEADTTISLETAGLYIAKVTSAEGQKSVKVTVQ